MEKEIAKTIINQINAIDKYALGSYGCFDENINCSVTVLNGGGDFQAGIALKVNGYNVTGYAVVMLKWNDTYHITFLDKDGQTLKTATDVYCDQLVSVLDYIEEGVPNNIIAGIDFGQNGGIDIINLN